ncbi:DUF2939 domain-containing protein [Paraburkholderia ferrariae]|uniref:DUF2939 domain-containing protein n=1 Tax=Paraburkholderia ferrariae TaxID=386056 RepID=UPI00047F9A25|nr:DUF2939 domain-containing protein [Paraburkholderia ferrariae]
MTESVSKKSWTQPVAIALIALVIVAALGYGYASPYVALNRLKTAADARDAATLNEYVDYPALRASLKQQVGELLQRRIEAQHSSNPLLLFGAVIGAALIGPLVDAYATPDGVAALLNGMPPSGKPGEAPPPAGAADNGATAAADGSKPGGTSGSTSDSTSGSAPGTAPENSTAPATSTAPAESEQPASRPQTTAGYRSLNEFVVTWQHDANGERYAAILQRHGLFSWKLAAVELNDSGQ